MSEKVKLYGTLQNADTVRVKYVLDQFKVSYDYFDVDEPKVLKDMFELTNGSNLLPTLIVDGQVIQDPSNASLIKLLKIDATDLKTHDLVTIGAGPSALTAAIYTSREDIETILFEKGVIGGLASITDWVDNYPGFPEGIAGLELGENLRKQAERFGAVIELGEVTKIINSGKYLQLDTTNGPIYARSVLIATGSDYKKIGVPGEAEYYGRGVHYCATCDGAFYRDKKLVVVGGGNSAAQEAVFLTRYASHIDLLVRSELKASEVLQHEIKKLEDKITVHLNITTDEIIGNDQKKVTKVLGTDTKSGKKVEFECDGVFVFVGLKPNTGFLKDSGIELDELGLVKTDHNLQTSMPGVFAAGDVRSGATMQIASAAGEGATAALMIRKYLEERDKIIHAKRNGGNQDKPQKDLDDPLNDIRDYRQ